MATAKTFKLSKDINLNLGNNKISIMKGYSRAPDLESNVKNVKFRETSSNSSKFFYPLEGSRETCFSAILATNFFIRKRAIRGTWELAKWLVHWSVNLALRIPRSETVFALR